MTKDPTLVPLYFRDDLDRLGDEHMQHIFRFLGLGRFDRAEFETQRGLVRWMRRNREAMIARDEAERLRAQKEQQVQRKQTTPD